MSLPVNSSILHRTSWTPPIALSGNGINYVLKDGRRLIDGVGGAAVAAIGNGHPAVIKAVQEQVEKMAFVYNMQLSNEPAEELAKILVETSNGAFSKVGFVSGGSEAMEAVIKLARQYYFETGEIKRTNFIGRRQSFHGNTIATLSLGWFPGRRAPYLSLLDTTSFHHVSPAYAFRYQTEGESEDEYVQRLADELEAKFQELGPDTVVGFVAETVSGASLGCVTPPKGYLKKMRDICHKYGALFILDEVMCGMGRMGTIHAWETYGPDSPPDIQAVAKGLGGGYASIGAVLMNERVAAGIRDNDGFWKHGHTYQAHPVGCAASLAVQKLIQDPPPSSPSSLLGNARAMGTLLSDSLTARLLAPSSISKPYVANIRGGGLFWGIEFEVSPAQQAILNEKKEFAEKGRNRIGILVQEIAFEKGLIVIGIAGTIDGSKGDHILLAPPYNVTEQEVQRIVEIVGESVDEMIRRTS